MPLGGGPSLPVTSCDQVEYNVNDKAYKDYFFLVFQVKRKICAEDHCRVVEGDEECHDKIVETAIEVPETRVAVKTSSWVYP